MPVAARKDTVQSRQALLISKRPSLMKRQEQATGFRSKTWNNSWNKRGTEQAGTG